MILDTTNGSTLYIEDAPDWSKPYSFDIDCFTTITKSKDGSEQRARQRNKPRYTLAYQIAALNTLEYALRKSNAIKSLGGLMAVPIWHAWRQFVSVSGDQVTLSAETFTLTLSQFKKGGLAYFSESGLTSTFRRISSLVNTSILNMLAGNCESPNIAMPAYTAACRVYPVIVGISDQNSNRFIPVDPFTTAQVFDVTEL